MRQSSLEDIAAKGHVQISEPVGIVRCEPIWEFKPYVLVDFLLWWVLDGVGRAWLEGQEFPLGPGACLILPPGAALTATHDPKRRLRVFYCHADFFDERGLRLDRETLATPPIPTIVNDLAALEPMTRQIIEGHATGTDTGRLQRDLALRLALLRIHASARAHPSRTDDSKLAAALQAVQENPGKPWIVTEIAARAGLSVSQAARRVRALTGQSPGNFVIHARIERAQRLMRESPLSLKQIADALGYSDVYFFHRQFKAVTGMTPGQWRKACLVARSDPPSFKRDTPPYPVV